MTFVVFHGAVNKIINYLLLCPGSWPGISPSCRRRFRWIFYQQTVALRTRRSSPPAPTPSQQRRHLQRTHIHKVTASLSFIGARTKYDKFVPYWNDIDVRSRNNQNLWCSQLYATTNELLLCLVSSHNGKFTCSSVLTREWRHLAVINDFRVN